MKSEVTITWIIQPVIKMRHFTEEYILATQCENSANIDIWAIKLKHCYQWEQRQSLFANIYAAQAQLQISEW